MQVVRQVGGEDNVNSHEPMGITSADIVRHTEEIVDEDKGLEEKRLGQEFFRLVWPENGCVQTWD